MKHDSFVQRFAVQQTIVVANRPVVKRFGNSTLCRGFGNFASGKSITRKLFVVVGALLFSWTFAGSLNAQGYTDTFARTGDAAPDGNGSFDSFHLVRINEIGQVAFLADFVGTSGGISDNRGLYRAGDGSIVQIARTGQAAPDGNGILGNVGFGWLTNSGTVGFTATYANTSGGSSDNRVLAYGSGGGFAQAARLGQQAPDGNGEFQEFFNANYSTTGIFSFIGELGETSGGNTDNQGFFVAGPSGVVQIARLGQPAPGGTDLYSSINVNGPSQNNVGSVAFSAYTTNSGGGMYVFSGGNTQQIMEYGQAAPDGNGVMGFLYRPRINDFGDVLFNANIDQSIAGNDDNIGLFLYRNGSLTQIMREGELAPDGDGLFAGNVLGAIRLNNAGTSVFIDGINNTSSGNLEYGIFRAVPGGPLTQIVRDGDAASDGNGTYSSGNGLSILNSFALNDSGVISYRANFAGTTGGSIDDVGLYLTDGTETVQVARKGQVLNGSLISDLLFVDGGLNNYGQVGYRASLANGDQMIRRFTPDLHWRGGIGSWDTSTNWTLGLDPELVHRTYIDPSSGGVVLGPGSDTRVQQLVVGGPAAAMLVLQQGVTLTIDNGLGVTPNGILAGSGMIDGDVSVRGTLRPSTGPQGVGAIRISGNLELVGSDLMIDIAGTGFGEFDYLSIAGDMFVGGDLLVNVDPLFELGSNMEFLFADVQGDLQGEFDGLANLSLVGTFGGRELFINYGAGDGNDISLFTVPEPASALILGLGLCAILLVKRSKRKQSCEHESSGV